MRGEADLYVHAFSGPGLPKTLRIRGHSLRTLTLGPVAVVVERCAAPDPTIEAITGQHDLIVALAARTPALLPARFGSRASEPALRALVREHAAAIVGSLELVRDCSQMTVRIFGAADDRPPLRQDVESGTEFLERRRAQAHYVAPEVAVVREMLASIVAAERVERGERDLRATVFHLVRNDVIDAYRREASRLQSRLPDHRVMVSGPWPPFAFTPELF
jgi:Gas vesicle synthesis protein GvpL/GvpF